MPNYNSTVRCSHCKCHGHNKATCADLTERYRELAIEHKQDQWRKIYERRSKLNLDTGEPISKKSIKPARKNKSATCSWCNYVSKYSLGHTRRTCTHLKETTARLIRLNAEYREEVCFALNAHGYGKGFAVSLQYDTRAELTIITDIDWNKVNIWQTTYGYGNMGEKALDGVTLSGRKLSISLPLLRGKDKRFVVAMGNRVWARPAGRKEGYDKFAHNLEYWANLGTDADEDHRPHPSTTGDWEGDIEGIEWQSGLARSFGASSKKWVIPAEFINGDSTLLKGFLADYKAKC